MRGTLGSHHWIFIDFDKIYVFYGKCCVRIDKCMFIVVKIKCVNSGRISDKVNFTTNTNILQHLTYILSKHTQYFIRTHTNITNFDTFNGTVAQQDLRIFLCRQPTNLTNPTQSDVLPKYQPKRGGDLS